MEHRDETPFHIHTTGSYTYLDWSITTHSPTNIRNCDFEYPKVDDSRVSIPEAFFCFGRREVPSPNLHYTTARILNGNEPYSYSAPKHVDIGEPWDQKATGTNDPRPHFGRRDGRALLQWSLWSVVGCLVVGFARIMCWKRIRDHILGIRIISNSVLIQLEM